MGDCSEYAEFKKNAAPSGGEQQLYKYYHEQSSFDGLLCAGSYSNKCSNFCTEPSKNEKGCFSCLSNHKCTAGPSGSVACCPYIAAAVRCNRCLSAHSSEELSSCMESGKMSVGEITGIVVGSVLFLLILFLVTRKVVSTQKTIQAKADLEDSMKDPRAKQLVRDLNLNGINAAILEDVERRTQLLQKR